MTSFLALATCRVLPEPDVDEAILVAALEAAGVPTRVVPWDDEDDAGFEGAALTVIRSTWNYHLRPGAFLAWAARRGARLVNPLPLVRWNHHKGYLRDLHRGGVPVVPTFFLERGAPLELDVLLGTLGWRDVVAKPAVSAASHATKRLRGPPFDAAFVAGLVEKGDTLVQPYVPAVETYGERSIVCIDGAITHAVRKNPRFAGGHEDVSSAVPIDPVEHALAERVLAWLGATYPASPPLYARVDMMRDAEGAPMVSEVELIEPSLFLRESPEALARFVDAIVGRLRQDRFPLRLPL